MRYRFNKTIFILFFSFLATCFLLSGIVEVTIAGESGIKIMQKEELGGFLASGNGMTLYSYSHDGKNVSNCVEGCARNWPPYYANIFSPVKGFAADDFATITRNDGSKQTTFKGMPLYRFINDKYPGDTFGNGIGGVWSIVPP